jgi:drug/metabolite transporter (DMT)-like permease
MSWMLKNSKAPLGASLVVVSSFFYASYGIWTKLMGNFFGGYTASALRSVLVLIILVPIAIRYRKFEPINLKRSWRWLGAMLLGSLIVWGPLYYAILHAGVGISIGTNYASYLIGMFLLGWFIAKERFTKDTAAAAAVCIVGLGLVFIPSVKGFGWEALAAAFMSGLGAAFVTFASKQIHYNPIQTTLALWVTSAIANIFMTFVVSEARPATGWHIQWLYLVFFAIASIFASWSLIKGLKIIDAGAAGVLGLLEIVFGAVFGVILFREKIGPIVLLGMTLIITAAAIPYIKDYNSERNAGK